MTIVHKSVLLNYSAEQMYALVEDMECYPTFLPWCSGADVQRNGTNTAIATISLNFCGLKQSFTTYNTNIPPTSIEMKLICGPFRHLEGQWTFRACGEHTSRIELYLNYEFSHFLMGRLLGPFFDAVSNSIVDSFCERAKKIYG